MSNSTADDTAPTSTLDDGARSPGRLTTMEDTAEIISRLTRERDDAQRMAAAWEQAGANARLTERLVRGDLDAERRSAAAHAEWYARRIVAGIAGAMGLDTSGEGDEIHARILAEHARLVGAVAAERARCAARVRDAAPTSALKGTPTLRAVAAALDAARRGIESGDTGADGDVVLTAVTRLTRELAEARAAIAADLRCWECGVAATRRWVGPPDCGGIVACDGCSADHEHWRDLPHAAAVRAARAS